MPDSCGHTLIEDVDVHIGFEHGGKAAPSLMLASKEARYRLVVGAKVLNLLVLQKAPDRHCIHGPVGALECVAEYFRAGEPDNRNGEY